MATRMVSKTRVRRRQMRMGMSTSVSGFDSTKSSQGRLHFLSFAENRVLLNILPVLLAISSVIFTAVYFLMVTCVDRGPLSHLIFFLSLQYHDLHYFNKFSDRVKYQSKSKCRNGDICSWHIEPDKRSFLGNGCQNYSIGIIR